VGMVKKQDIIFDSTKLEYVGGPKKPSLPRFYFPIIIVIILAEAVVLSLIIFDMLPIHVFQIYPYAQYAPYVSASDVTNIAVTITKWFFFLLTAGVLVPTTIIIILEVARRLIISRRGKEQNWDDDFPILDKLDKQPKLPAYTKERVQGDYIVRFDIHQRIQHYALMGSFIILAVTGLLRGFPDWPTFQWFTSIFGGVEVLRLVHDVAAFIMIADGIYHLGYIAYGYFVLHRSPAAMFPKWKDLKDILHSLLWTFGMYKNEPEYDHFQYGQKIDYWAIFWGMPVMVITGIMMMFPSLFAPLIGGNWMAVMATAHRDEAILATGFILIVHMYYGHLQTTAFPVNTVMFTGKMLKSKYKQWFGREYAQLTDEKEEK
jgi:formate dehydrogenase subunit gamma